MDTAKPMKYIISVIIPVYNGEKFLRECLDSVLNQSLEEIQIICVNDGSTDSTSSILKEYESNDDRLFIVTMENHSNAGNCRNEGMKYATGEYLSFLDADDFFEPNMLKDAYEVAKRDDADICMFRRQLFDNAKGVYVDSLWSMKLEEMPSNRPFSSHESSDSLFTMSSCTAWDKLFKRSFIQTNNILFQNIESCNDMLFVYSAYSVANSITTLDKVLAYQRINHPKHLSKGIEYLWSNFYYALLALKNFLIEKEIYAEFKNSFVNWAIDFCMWNKDNFGGIFKEYIIQALKHQIFNTLDISSTPRDYFQNKLLFDEMESMIAEIGKSDHKNIKPSVSIIVPTYNVEQYLSICLNSLIYQTLDNIEIIIVNDGSTDSSIDIIKEYEAIDERIKVINQQNGGYGKAMNIGLDNATGEYIGIVEPDDFVELSMFEELYSVAKQNDLDFVKSDFNRFTHDKLGNLVLSYNKIAKEIKNYNKIIEPAKNFWTFRYTMNTWTGIYKNEFIRKNNIRHNETPGASFQDNGFWFQTFMYARRAMFIDRAYYYNRRDNPNSSVLSTNKIWCMSEEYKYIKSLIERRTDLYNKFIRLIHVTKFRNYMFTLKMIGDQEKQEYIKRFYEEYLDAKEKDELDKSLFLDNEWETLSWILKNPESFLEYNISNTPKISVIIPIYNMEAHLEQCLNSVLYQTLKKIEVICINDGSSDRSLEIVNKYIALDNRIILLDQDNQGVGQSRNNGIKIAKGEFICFLDPDDWYPTKNILESLYVGAKSNGALICGGSFSTFKDGNVITKYEGEYSKYVFTKNGYISYMDYQFDYGFHRFIYKTEFIRSNNIYFPLYSRYQDPPFFVKAMTTAGRFYAISQVVYRYRKSNKPFVWTREKVNDMVRGVLDDIIYSRINNLDLIHYYSVMRLNHDFIKPIVENINKDNIELLILLAKVNANIDVSLLNKHFKTVQKSETYIIKPLYRIVFK